MQINRNDLLLQIAYFPRSSSRIPKVIDTCTLRTRFAISFIPWLVVVAVFYVASIFTGLYLFVFKRPAMFFVKGQSYSYLGHRSGFEWLPGFSVLSYLWPQCYYAHQSSWLAWMPIEKNGRRVTPAELLVGVGLILSGVVLIFYVIPVYLFATIWHECIVPTIGYLASSIGGWGPYVLGPVALMVMFLLGRHAYRTLLSTETGRILTRLYAEWKARYCSTIEVVD